jgi:hypothetical protein
MAFGRLEGNAAGAVHDYKVPGLQVRGELVMIGQSEVAGKNIEEPVFAYLQVVGLVGRPNLGTGVAVRHR